jgi:hypothetical protein
MANYSFSRLERAYLQKQPTFGTIPNASGTASVATNSNACRFIRMELQNDVALLERPDKTGTRSQEGMVGGRKAGRWSIEMSLAANGTSGTAPDCDPILVAMFGQTAAVGAGTYAIASSTAALPIVITCAAHGITSGTFEVVTIAGHTVNTAANGTWLAYAGSTTALTLVGSDGSASTVGGATGTVSRVKLTYTFIDDITQFTLWSFRTAATLDQRVGHTCVVAEATFNLNQDVATWQANGDCLWVLRSKDFATADVYQAGGLTTFTPEPTTPVTSGSIIPGFTGRFVAGASSTTASVYATAAVAFPTIRNATIRVQTNNMLVRDTFGSYYATLTEGDVRNVTLSFNIYDDDSAAVNLLKTWGDSKAPVDFVLNLGTVAGNVWVHYMKNVYLASHQLSDGQLRFDASYADSRATTSNLGVKDEYSLIIA